MRANLALLAFGGVVLAAQGAWAEAASPARGRELVQAHCAQCHAVGRADASPNPAAPALRNLHLFLDVDSLAGPLARGGLVGHPKTAPYAFSAGEAADVVADLRSLQTR